EPDAVGPQGLRVTAGAHPSTHPMSDIQSGSNHRRGEPTMQNQGSFGDTFDSMKEGASQIGGPVAHAASAVVSSVGTAASDAKTAVANTASKVAKKAAK